MWLLEVMLSFSARMFGLFFLEEHLVMSFHFVLCVTLTHVLDCLTMNGVLIEVTQTS